MTQHIIQPIKITPRLVNCLPQFFMCFFVCYIIRNHKDTTHPWGKRLNTTLYFDQNTSQACQPDFLETWRVWIFLFKKPAAFILKKDILKSQKILDSRLFLYSLSHYPHQQKFFGVLLNYCVLNLDKAGLFEGTFLGGRGGVNLTPPPLYFKRNLSNINIALYNC